MPAGADNINNPQVINECIVTVTVIKLVILTIFLLPLARYAVFPNETIEKNTTNPSITDTKPVMNETNRFLNSSVGDKSCEVVTIARKMLPQQPACPRSQMISILNAICDELSVKNELCTSEDFHNRDKHKIPKHYARNRYSSSKQAPQLPAIVNWALGGLLVTSLCAALVELYRAKRHPEKNKHPGKHPLGRKCSLADLTVLKHHRKEMVRRDSLMGVPEEGALCRQPGFTPPPLHRRCSFPIGPAASPLAPYGTNNRRPSLVRSGGGIESRRPSVTFDGRRHSVVMESRRTSIAGSISCGDEETKRHHARLVHRH